MQLIANILESGDASINRIAPGLSHQFIGSNRDRQDPLANPPLPVGLVVTWL